MLAIAKLDQDEPFHLESMPLLPETQTLLAFVPQTAQSEDAAGVVFVQSCALT